MSLDVTAALVNWRERTHKQLPQISASDEQRSRES